jgi:putative metallohydrolase (TIGR04338 family)
MMMKRERDSQRSRVYRAERKVNHGKPFKDIKEVRKYVEKLCKSPWFKKHFVPRPINVRTGGYAVATADLWGIRIPEQEWSLNELVVLHEVAHVCSRAVTTREAGHGITFCKTFIKLVQHKIGKATSDDLKKQFKQEGVKYCAKKKLSVAQRKALSERARQNLTPIAAKPKPTDAEKEIQFRELVEAFRARRQI